MSSHSYDTTCSECEKDTLKVCESNRPYPQIDVTCLSCGFFTTTSEGYLSDDELKSFNE